MAVPPVQGGCRYSPMYRNALSRLLFLPALSKTYTCKGYPHQGSDLLAVEGAEFGQVGQQGARGHRTDAGDTAQEVFLDPPQGGIPHRLVQVSLSTSSVVVKIVVA